MDQTKERWLLVAIIAAVVLLGLFLGIALVDYHTYRREVEMDTQKSKEFTANSAPVSISGIDDLDAIVNAVEDTTKVSAHLDAEELAAIRQIVRDAQSAKLKMNCTYVTIGKDSYTAHHTWLDLSDDSGFSFDNIQSISCQVVREELRKP